MKQKHFVSLLGLLGIIAVGVPSAMAADSFSGLYILGGIGQKSTNVELNAVGVGATGSAKTGDTSFFGQLSGGYTFAPGGDFRLGIGAFFDLGDGKAGDGSATVGGISGAFSLKETRHYGISIEPGLAVTKDSLAYAKLMYNWIKGEANATGVSTTSENFRAFGYGLGLKHLINANTFLYAEWQKADYDTKSFSDGAGGTFSLKPRQAVGLFGVGMTF